jgi:hypothetical protein
MFHSQKLSVFMAIIIVGSIILAQQSMGTYVGLASKSSVYSSGFAQGCDDVGISDPDERSINQPGKNLSFTTDEFTRGYAAGFDICSENREMKFLGLKIIPEISIGDIAAIAALIASPLIFWFGYSRTRKSEQIKIAREHMDRLDKKYAKLEYGFAEFEAGVHGDPSPRNTDMLKKRLEDVDDITNEIDYLDNLVASQEVVDKNVLSYSSHGMTKTLQKLITKLDNVQEREQELKQSGVSNEAFKEVQKMSRKLNDKSKIWKRRGSL